MAAFSANLFGLFRKEVLIFEPCDIAMLFRACCDATIWSLKEQTSSDYTIVFHRYISSILGYLNTKEGMASSDVRL